MVRKTVTHVMDYHCNPEDKLRDDRTGVPMLHF